MKTKILLLILLLSAGMAGYSTTWQITNSGFSFSPATVTIQQGDDVNFTLESMHNAVEVSSATWTANGSTSNNGFMVPFGGGSVAASKLTVGTHYYVCEPHASLGMKGKIVVVNATAIVEIRTDQGVTLGSNPVRDVIQLTVNENNLVGSEYRLYNQLGQQLMNGRLSGKTNLIAVSQLPAGVYFLQIAAPDVKPLKILIRN
ncbi:MAG: plastocyanin/azurin family copper-binding protein [Paludibacter sp.]